MKTIHWTLIALLLVAGIFAYLYFNKTGTGHPETLIVHDTTTITRYETQLKRDTVLKWYERIITKESKPVVIYQQKIDSVFIEKVKEYDLILGIDKKGTNLRVFALNQNSMLLKEQLFENVYNDFTAFSATDKVIVKSDLFYWNGINAGYEHKRPVNDLKSYSHLVDVTTGMSFIDRVSLDGGAEYDLTAKDFRLKAKLTLKVF